MNINGDVCCRLSRRYSRGVVAINRFRQLDGTGESCSVSKFITNRSVLSGFTCRFKPRRKGAALGGCSFRKMLFGCLKDGSRERERVGGGGWRDICWTILHPHKYSMKAKQTSKIFSGIRATRTTLQLSSRSTQDLEASYARELHNRCRIGTNAG